MKRGLSMGLAILTGTGMVAYLAWHRDSWAEIRLVSPGMLGVCAIATMLAVLIPGPLFTVMVNRFGPQVGWLEGVYLAIATTAINVFVPFHGGAAFRAVYLKRRHGFDLTSFVATFFGYNVLRILVVAFLGLLAAGWIAGKHTDHSMNQLMAVAGGCFAAALAACLMPPELGQRFSFLRWMSEFSRGWQAIRQPRRFFALLLLLTALQFLAELVALWSAWAALGATLDVTGVVLIGAFGTLAAMTGLTPNGIGLYELTVAAVGSTIAVDPVLGILAALLLRGILVGVLLVAAPLAVFGLGREPLGKPSERLE